MQLTEAEMKAIRDEAMDFVENISNSGKQIIFSEDKLVEWLTEFVHKERQRSKELVEASQTIMEMFLEGVYGISFLHDGALNRFKTALSNYQNKTP